MTRRGVDRNEKGDTSGSGSRRWRKEFSFAGREGKAPFWHAACLFPESWRSLGAFSRHTCCHHAETAEPQAQCQ